MNICIYVSCVFCFFKLQNYPYLPYYTTMSKGSFEVVYMYMEIHVFSIHVQCTCTMYMYMYGYVYIHVPVHVCINKASHQCYVM